MIRDNTPIKQIRLTTVWASQIAQWWYCGWKLMLVKNYGEETTPEMDEGRAKHDIQSEEDIGNLIEKGWKPKSVKIRTAGERWILNLHNVLNLDYDVVLPDNRSHRFFYGIIPFAPPIVGVPDAIGREKRGYYVIYERKQHTKNSHEAYMGQRMQVCAYLMMLEAIGISKCFGAIHTTDHRKDPNAVRIYLTDKDRKLVLESAKRIHLMQTLQLEPMPTRYPSKCVSCQMGPNFRNLCVVSPLKPDAVSHRRADQETMHGVSQILQF